MTDVILSPSILGYEQDVEGSMEAIRSLVDAGVPWLHVDIMRDPFIPGRNAFMEHDIRTLQREFGKDVVMDYHLMVTSPLLIIREIDSFVPENQRERVNVTIHREAHRPSCLFEYASKDYDLLDARSGDPEKNTLLRGINECLGGDILSTLVSLKDRGYSSGLALEPGTSLYNISPDMVEYMDMILLMSVVSGKGGQKYHGHVTQTIADAKGRYPDKMVQVDGGINAETLPLAVGAGADNVVIGSYITGSDNPAAKTREVLSTL